MIFMLVTYCVHAKTVCPLCRVLKKHFKHEKADQKPNGVDGHQVTA